MQTSDSVKSIIPALLASQSEMGSPSFDMEGRYGKYSSLKELMRVARPKLNEYGILIMQPPADYDTDRKSYVVETRLVHAETGEYVSCRVDIPMDKATAHGVGSSITYGRRYGLGSLCGIVADEDDDGMTAEAEGHRGKPQRPTPRPDSNGHGHEDTPKSKAINAAREWSGKAGDDLTEAIKIVASGALGQMPTGKLNDDQWVRVEKYVNEKQADGVSFDDIAAVSA